MRKPPSPKVPAEPRTPSSSSGRGSAKIDANRILRSFLREHLRSELGSHHKFEPKRSFNLPDPHPKMTPHAHWAEPIRKQYGRGDSICLIEVRIAHPKSLAFETEKTIARDISRSSTPGSESMTAEEEPQALGAVGNPGLGSGSGAQNEGSTGSRSGTHSRTGLKSGFGLSPSPKHSCSVRASKSNRNPSN